MSAPRRDGRDEDGGELGRYDRGRNFRERTGAWGRNAMRPEDAFRRQERDYEDSHRDESRFGRRDDDEGFRGNGGTEWTQPRFEADMPRRFDEYDDGDSTRFRARRSGRREHAWQRSGPHAGKGPRNYQRADDRILEDVNQALEWDSEIDATEIEVSCETGTVVLRGTVESRQARRDAEACVENLSGVKDVRNELRVQDRSEARPSTPQEAGTAIRAGIPSNGR
jgi:hypothetical protein